MTAAPEIAPTVGGYEREREAPVGPDLGPRLEVVDGGGARTGTDQGPALQRDPSSYQRLLVLGLGNDILTDDAVGLLVARELAVRFKDHPDIAVRETTEMGLALLDELADFDAVILVDAVQTGRVPPGTIHECDIAELPEVTATSPHFIGVGETLGFGRRLGLAMPGRVRVVAIEVADPYTLGTEPTELVRKAVALAVERVVALIRDGF